MSKFHSPAEEFNPGADFGPHWETPGLQDRGYSSPDSQHAQEQFSSQKPSVEKTISILRENLKKIQIHLN